MLKKFRSILLSLGFSTSLLLFLAFAANSSAPLSGADKREPKDTYVRATVPLYSKKAERGASGCPISPTTLLTAAHVWENTEEAGDLVIVWAGEIKVQLIPVRKIFLNHDRDIALLEIAEDAFKFPFWSPMRKKAPFLGERLKLSLSNPNAVDGILFGNMAFMNDGFFMLDITAFPGTSGSCVLDSDNFVIGILSGVWSVDGIAMRPIARVVSVKEIK